MSLMETSHRQIFYGQPILGSTWQWEDGHTTDQKRVGDRMKCFLPDSWDLYGLRFLAWITFISPKLNFAPFWPHPVMESLLNELSRSSKSCVLCFQIDFFFLPVLCTFLYNKKTKCTKNNFNAVFEKHRIASNITTNRCYHMNSKLFFAFWFLWFFFKSKCYCDRGLETADSLCPVNLALVSQIFTLHYKVMGQHTDNIQVAVNCT